MFEHRPENKSINPMNAGVRPVDAVQNRWNQETVDVQWECKWLIVKIEPWLRYKHRQLDYYLTQILTAYGAFRSFAKKIGKDVSDACITVLI